MVGSSPKFGTFTLFQNNITSVNSRLDKGWQLLAVSPGTYDDGDSNKAYFLYTLGYTKS